MPTPFLLIDGYNLMYAAGLARVRYAPGDLERCRHRLLVLIAEQLHPDQRARTTVVFDAQEAPPGAERRMTHQGISVLFAEPGQDADTFLELLIATHSASRQIVLVSSDHRLQKAVAKRHGRSLDSDKFLEVLASGDARRQPETVARSSGRSGGGKHTTVGNRVPAAPADDLDYWLQQFGSVDPATLVPPAKPSPSVRSSVPAQKTPAPTGHSRTTDDGQRHVVQPIAADQQEPLADFEAASEPDEVSPGARRRAGAGDSARTALPPTTKPLPAAWLDQIRDVEQRLQSPEELDRWLNERPDPRRKWEGE